MKEEKYIINISFDAGSLVISGEVNKAYPIKELLTYDERIEAYRTHAHHYRTVLHRLKRANIPYRDTISLFTPYTWKMTDEISLRNYQQEAVDSWDKKGRRGVIVLPTGVGKSIVAVDIIGRLKLSTIVVLPTIDLMIQWASVIERHLEEKVAILGGGKKEVGKLTVTTYDSARLMMEFIGDKFGLIIFDESHHLPGPSYRCAAEMSCAPYRLGLTATPEREDGGEEIMFQLLGPLVFRREIDAFSQDTLSPYHTERIYIPLEGEEKKTYQRERAIYKNFLKRHRVRMGSATGWQYFLRCCAIKADGKEGMRAYQAQKRIASAGRGKLKKIWQLLQQHAGERILIFTAFNDLAYEIGELWFLPVLTHLTNSEERKAFLTGFREGKFPVLVTSRVLNEGVDVPEASVGIVVSGTGSVREHVQRLGRILRPQKKKKAFLYELVSSSTGEYYTSESRRKHRAYQRSSSVSGN